MRTRLRLLLPAAAGLIAVASARPVPGAPTPRASPRTAPSPAASPAPSPSAAPSAPKLETLTWGSVERMHRYGEIYLASQPAKEDFDLAKASGVRTVVNLRKPGEIDWNEKTVVEGLGMQYDNFPFQHPEELTDDVLDGVRRVLAAAGDRPLLLHCSSANRVGAVWLAHRVLDDAVPFSDALVEAEAVGLKSPAFRDRVTTYIEERRKK
jgi:uncharacterized protein (TIGR01244 family)